MDKVLPQENKKVSTEEEAHENIEYNINENDLYQIENTSLDDKREKTGWHKHVFESKLENKYSIDIQNGMTCKYENKVNKWYECNLLHDTLNTPRNTKN